MTFESGGAHVSVFALRNPKLGSNPMMIRRFVFDGQTIALHPSAVLNSRGESLFAADSMTLLVGVNGAGKTRALATLASNFTQEKAKKADATAVHWDSLDERADMCAIYYTPVPFQIEMPKNGHRFRCIQPNLVSKQKSLSARKQEVTKELEKEFGLEARRLLHPFQAPQTAINRLTAEVLDGRSKVVDPWVVPYRDRRTLLHEAQSAAYRRDGTFDRLEMARTYDESDKVSSEFLTELRARVGTEFAIKLRAYGYAREQSKRALQKSTELQLLEAFGFVLNTAPPKQPRLARRYFEEALKGLRSIAAIVGDPKLESSSYQVDDDQISDLNRLPLGKLGQISLASVSSGAAALIDQFTSIRLASEEFLKTDKCRRLLLLIDEGDAFLHLGWQQQYVEYLDKTVRNLKAKFSSVQVVIASHSPILMSDFPRECIFLLDRRDWIDEVLDSSSLHRPKVSFAAPLDAVVRDVGKAGSLGAFATRIIKELVQDVLDGDEVNPDRLAMIDDPVIRRQIARLVDSRHNKTNEV